MRLTGLQLKLVNEYQRDFPLEPEPFARIAADLGVGEAEILHEIKSLAENGVLTRLGAVVCPNTAGASTLAAMEVPAGRLDEIAALVSAQPQVNHNYEREHRYNLWFVVTACDREEVLQALARIEALTGLKVIELPMEKAYHIDLGFAL